MVSNNKTDMAKHNLTSQELEKIIDIARLAPSVHNIQPWKVKNREGELEVTIDKNYQLEAGDPTGRQTIISLGIFTEAISLAARSISLQVDALRFDSDKATLSFAKSVKSNGEDIKLLKDRATDRSIYSEAEIAKNVKVAIENCATDKSVRVWVINDKDFIQKLADLTAKGISLALSNPQFRNELSHCLVRYGWRKKRGISVKSLYIPAVLAQLQPELLRLGISTGKEAKLEKRRWLSASIVVLITTDGDLQDDWFHAGQTYLKVSLMIEKSGLSQATSAATIEAATFHEDVEEMLGTNQRLQAVLRVGKGAAKKYYSPRASAKELIT